MGAVTIAVEPDPRRRTIALRLGARHAVLPEDAAPLLADLTGGRGADVVVEVSGRPAVMARALELAGFKGRVAYVGINVGDAVPARLGLIQSKELKITGSIGSPGVWPDTLRFLANSGIDMTPLVTQHFDVEHALDALEAAHHPHATIKAHIELRATLHD